MVLSNFCKQWVFNFIFVLRMDKASYETYETDRDYDSMEQQDTAMPEKVRCNVCIFILISKIEAFNLGPLIKFEETIV